VKTFCHDMSISNAQDLIHVVVGDGVFALYGTTPSGANVGVFAADHGIIKYRKSVRANFGRNTCTSDIFDAAPNRRTTTLTLRPFQPLLCNADLGIVLHNQHTFNYIIV
jgi:hypothetical protein